MGAALRALLLLLAALALYGAAHGLGLSRYLNAFPLAKAGMGYGALLLLGVMTSLHCVAMCGGIGMAQSTSAARNGRSIARANLLDNLGRVASYTLTCGLVGALGTVLSLSDGMKAAVQIIAALFMLVMALNLLGDFSLTRRLSLSLPKGLYAPLAGKGSSSLLLGLLNGLMPCGPLQAMQLYALSTGSAARGALSMLLFNLGTVLLMLGAGLAAGRLRKSAASLLRTASALIVLFMGLNMLAQGLALCGITVSLPAQETPAPTADGIARLDGDVQRVLTEIGYGSYPPITVQAGVPVEWTLRVPEGRLNGCNNEIVIPAYGLRVELQPGDNLVAFTPGVERLHRSRVAVFGIGGVGGYAAEALVCSGLGAIDLFDDDRICLTNLNRQVIALRSTVGRYKAEVMAERLRDINPDVRVGVHKLFYMPDTAQEVDLSAYDYVIDAVDTVTAKLTLICRADALGVPVISAMGAGNKLDPTRLTVADIYETSVCPLARVMRRELRRRGIRHLKVVYSTEPPIKTDDDPALSCKTHCICPPGTVRKCTVRRGIPGSTAFVPPVMGLIIAGEVARSLAGVSV